MRYPSVYTSDQIREAFERTVTFFKLNPKSWLQGQMSNGKDHSPFNPDAECFCFGGRLARELGPLSEDYVKEHFDASCGYEAGYSELWTIGHRFDQKVFEVNDNAETLLDVLVKERQLFQQEDLI